MKDTSDSEMTAHHDLYKMYMKGDIITVCAFSYKEFIKGNTKTIDHMVHGEIIQMIPPIKNYMNYLHGYCANCMDKYLHSLGVK